MTTPRIWTWQNPDYLTRREEQEMQYGKETADEQTRRIMREMKARNAVRAALRTQEKG